MAIESSAGIIVFRNKESPRFLVLHYKAGHWDFPKGHIEKGETEEETAKRETEEETGISELEFYKGFKEKISFSFRRRKENVDKDVVFFLAETKTEGVVLSHEHSGFKWLNFEDALKILTFENARKIIKQANNFIKNSQTKSE